jgi:hypothetical protein
MPRNGDRRAGASSEQLVELTNKLDQFVLKVTDSNARTDESIKSMKDRLFGGEGHKGMIEYFNQEFVDIKAEVANKAQASDLKELTKDFESLKNRVTWYAGILAAIQFLIMAAATAYAGWHH